MIWSQGKLLLILTYLYLSHIQKSRKCDNPRNFERNCKTLGLLKLGKLNINFEKNNICWKTKVICTAISALTSWIELKRIFQQRYFKSTTLPSSKITVFLPSEVWNIIFRKLDSNTLRKVASLVCKQWFYIIRNDLILSNDLTVWLD